MAKPRKSGPSGRSLTRAEHIARGRVMVSVWLEADDAELLAELEAEEGPPGARARVVRRAVRELHGRTVGRAKKRAAE